MAKAIAVVAFLAAVAAAQIAVSGATINAAQFVTHGLGL